jgi:heavy metal translocating P-type ATPase
MSSTPFKLDGESTGMLLEDSEDDGDEVMVATIKIKGMSCAACVGRIESALSKQSGIERATVNLMTERGTVTFDPKVLGPEQVAERVTDIGFPSTVVEDGTPRTPGSPGMSVEIAMQLAERGAVLKSETEWEDDCAQLEVALRQAPGVESAVASAAGRRAKLRIDTMGGASLGPLVAAAADRGLTATVSVAAPDESESSSLSKSRDDEAAVWHRRFVISTTFTIPVFLIMKIFPLFDFTGAIVMAPIGPGLPLGPLLCMFFTAPVQFYIGRVFYIGAWKALQHGTSNMDVLVVLGTSTAYFYSVFVLIDQVINPMDPGHPCFEASAMLITFLTLGRMLECRAKGQTSRALEKLMGMASSTAVIVIERGGGEEELESEIPAELVQLGDVCLLRPGCRVPVDGTVVSGSSYVDESILTGEWEPVPKKEGDTVVGGSINKDGALRVRATRVGADTTLAQIVKLVEDAQSEKPPVQEFADRVSAVFVPFVVSCAVLVFVGWYGSASAGLTPEEWMPQGQMFFSLMFAVSVVVIACPCALGLATPTAVMVGTGVGASMGILIKGGKALEVGHNVTAVCFDKTGTLTIGKPTCLHVTPAAASTKDHSSSSSSSSGTARRELLQVLVAAEKSSEHPIAQSLVQYAESQLELEEIAAASNGGGDLFADQNTSSSHEDDSEVTTFAIAVEGMMCGNCETKVRKAAEAMPGVHSAVVDWEAGTAIVYGDSSIVTMAEVVDAIECTGKDAAELKTMMLIVDGMMCGNCEGKVRTALEAVEGVREAIVDWEAGTAVVKGSMAADGSSIVDAVENTGKDAALLTTVKLDVEGMMCGNCEGKVKGALEAVEGVRDAIVDWEAGTAVVEGTAKGSVLVDAVEDSGKDARLVSEEPYTPPDASEGGGGGRIPTAKDFKAVPGRGVLCSVLLPGHGRPMAVCIGNRALMEDQGIDLSTAIDQQ